MNFFIRTNIGTNIGIGHLVRVSRLADRLHKLGHKCWFFVDHLPKNNFAVNFRYKAQFEMAQGRDHNQFSKNNDLN